MATDQLTLHGDRFYLRTSYDNRHDCKQIPGYTWDSGRKCWHYPAAPSSLREILRVFPHVKIHESAVAMVEQFKASAHAVRAAKDAGWKAAEPVAQMPITVEPFKHQVLGFNIGIQIPNVALLMEMGTGKTLTMLSIIGRRYLDGYIRRVLIVAPTSVVPVWPAEFARFADFPVQVEIYEGEKAKRTRKFRKEQLARFFDETTDRDLRVLVTNYESIPNTYKELAEWGPDCIVCDESQRIKNPTAARSKAMHFLGEKTTYKAILTGTPITQGPHDFFSQYKFLEPSIFGKVFATFRKRYLVMGGFENREITDYRHLEDLERRAHSIAYRVRKDDCLDLPGALPAYHLADLEPSARKLYDQIAEEAVGEIEAQVGEDGELSQITVTNILTKLLRLQQITGGYVQDDEGEIQVVSQAKMKLFREQLTDDLEGGAKVVVFARFRPEIKAITEWLAQKGIDHSLIWGDTKKGEARSEQVRRFQEDKQVKVFVAQIQTAGLGITLTAGSINHFYSCSYSFGDYDQALARTDRIGQTVKVTNRHLIVDNTCDVDVLRALRRKRNVADAVVDGLWRELIQGRSFVSVDDFAAE